VPKYAAVGVAKALAESLMRYLAVELAPSGVRINAVAPAIVETDAVRTLFGAEAAGLVRVSQQERSVTGALCRPASVSRQSRHRPPSQRRKRKLCDFQS
jgi:NAD(P)-dependent dehydrogenase (short-subunit alcohol dehydrogenase family)